MKRLPIAVPSIAAVALDEEPATAAGDTNRTAGLDDRAGLMRLMQCRLRHRSHWHVMDASPTVEEAAGVLDAYICDRCERTWQRTRLISDRR